ncbi:hypothetical protein POM88_051176 [Heracleum sosnowskyi]|uniref:RNase H type-1 domain-containing protein n=1 Tax=Heracleum sosnowskyi TaxID=360622 RepID=A0AAD8GYW6_9APIA|nr:hypothetical protein POM88_051176 [Heracleum sosnowskyi]
MLLAHGDDVPVILGTPIGNVGIQDQLVWHFCKDGNYSVKSGYKVAAMNNNVASSSNEGIMKNWWKLLWNLPVIPKVKVFILEAVQKLAPCGQHPNEKRRNKQLHGLSYPTDDDLINMGLSYICVPTSHFATNLDSSNKTKESWHPPPPGVILINCDAAVVEGKKGCGLGVVPRDFRGRVLRAQATFMNGIISIEAAEAMALRNGMYLAKDLGCGNYYLSSDCANAVGCLKKRDTSLADWHVIIEDIISSDHFFSFCSQVFYSPRSSNKMAHNIARFSLKHCISKCWTGSRVQ